MPTKRAMPSISRDQACADCAIVSSNLLEIRKRYLCSDCFTKYVLFKVLKRMEAYNFKNFKNQVGEHRPKLLLPLSGGSSSLVLLHALDIQLKRQDEKRNKRSYDLVLVHINSDEHIDRVETWRASVQDKFNGYEFMPLIELSDIFQHDKTIEDDLSCLGLVRHDDEADTALLARLWGSTKTPSAKADLYELLTKRLLVSVAKGTGCEGVLWGHSDSRLAAKALADVAKGRGGSSSTAMADGMSPWDINFNFPVRELYKAELDLYLQCQNPILSEFLLESDHESDPPVSIRNTSIDALLSSYITSQGEKYPSIMANVVRTTAKLQTQSPITGQKCKLCSMSVAMTNPTTMEVCYGCNRMKQDIKI